MQPENEKKISNGPHLPEQSALQDYHFLKTWQLFWPSHSIERERKRESQRDREAEKMKIKTISKIDMTSK